MPRRIALALIAAGLLAGCGGGGSGGGATAAAGPAPREPVRLTRCDDGGSGGVLIDGVCI